MIDNVPTSQELRTISLRLYFKAWNEISSIVTEWQDISGLSTPKWSEGKGRFYLDPADEPENEETSDWREYIEAAQNDLQGIYTLIQQSQEIGLKARICEISPFLLIKRTDVKAADASTSTWDFTDFPTLDASELVRVHNIFCSTVLPEAFQSKFDEIRKNRNKIYHLGIYRRKIDPQLIFDILQLQYEVLFPGRRWMADRLHFATIHRLSGYTDDHYNERSILFYELWRLLPGLSDAQFKWLMLHSREEPRYICHSCVGDARLGEHEPYPADVPSAYRADGSLAVHCVICDRSNPMRAGKCPDKECGCEFVSADPASDGACMRCGWTEDQWLEEQKSQARYAARSKSPFNDVGD